MSVFQGAAPVGETQGLESLTKAQLIELARSRGIKVDSRNSKAQIIAAITG